MNKFWKRKSEELRILDKRKKLRKKIRARRRAGRPTMQLEAQYTELGIKWWNAHDPMWLDAPWGFDVSKVGLTLSDVTEYMKTRDENAPMHMLQATDTHVDVTFFYPVLVNPYNKDVPIMLTVEDNNLVRIPDWMTEEEQAEVQRQWREHLATGE